MKRAPLVGVVMGSRSDYDILQPAIEILQEFSVPHEARVVSAHRTPDWLFEYAETAEKRGLRVLIAGAGGAAHLPGMLAAKTHLPVLGVPIPATMLAGVDSLLSIVQMPKGVPVGTLAIGKPGAANAALLAISILALEDRALRDRLVAWRENRKQEVLAHTKLFQRRSQALDGDARSDSSGIDDRYFRRRAVGAHDGDGGTFSGLSHPGARS